MQTYFNELADHIGAQLKGKEVFTATFDAEDSDFVRFNHNEVRQAGSVTQRRMGIHLIDGQRHVSGDISLSGEKDGDQRQISRLLEILRATLPSLPDDPHLLYSEDVQSGEHHGDDQLPPGPETVQNVIKVAKGKDLIGIYAAGGIHSGFANSFGQRNWYSTHSFNLDWSIYHQRDKAVKKGYAGFVWNQDDFAGKMREAKEQLKVLARKPRTIKPGKYRVYLSPVAMFDILNTLAWGGFGLKDHRTKQTTLLKMIEEGAELHPQVTISENTAEGVAPNFQSAGFIKPGRVPLIEDGCFRNCLASPRSAKEYGVATNGASGWEAPESFDMAAGNLPQADVLGELDEGLYINNVWYLNYSDRPACRMTGMTRFATFWVEGGKIAAPVNVMRFDETIYRMLGDNLVGLTAERDFLLDAETYEQRSTQSGRLPGALVNDFALTL